MEKWEGYKSWLYLVMASYRIAFTFHFLHELYFLFVNLFLFFMDSKTFSLTRNALGPTCVVVTVFVIKMNKSMLNADLGYLVKVI